MSAHGAKLSDHSPTLITTSHSCASFSRLWDPERIPPPFRDSARRR